MVQSTKTFETLITAHAGAEGTLANSMESLEILLRCGADVVEIDLRSQGELMYLSHDRAPDPGACASLEQALAAIRETPHIRYNVDMKETALLPRVWAVASSMGMENQLLFTGSLNTEDIAFALKVGAVVFYNADLLPMSQWPRASLAARELGFSTLNVNHRFVTDKQLKEHARGLSLWTVDEEARLRELLVAGVTNITTRKPLLALRLRQEIQDS